MDLKINDSFDLSPEPSLNLQTKLPVYSDKKNWPAKEVTRDIEAISIVNEGVDQNKSKKASIKNGSPQQRKKKFLSYRKKSVALDVKRAIATKKKSGLTVTNCFIFKVLKKINLSRNSLTQFAKSTKKLEHR
jgi:hypothetical protein